MTEFVRYSPRRGVVTLNLTQAVTSRHVHKAGDALSSRHVSSCNVSSPHETCATKRNVRGVLAREIT